ncbi:hypothetical protein CHS0354_030645 [Potamilus streckersoni]|uniref:Vesicular, overexpressed in cancer, prosurvival protein 1 n=1 Tax=Potamilus streckersoni TaxID=2493646 RepID=A0AAE0SIF4_9BIVA|nr:hypothetical protein CHS0354_030645 [Potamilus streckersoni]
MDREAGLWTFSVILSSEVSYGETSFCIDTSNNVTNLCPWGCCNSGFCCAKPSTSYFWLFGALGAAIAFVLILYFFRKRCSRSGIVQTPRDMGEMSQVNAAYSSRSIPAYCDPPPYISTIYNGTNPSIFPADCDPPPPYELPPSYEEASKGNNDNERR